jgi:hypothetical protein
MNKSAIVPIPRHLRNRSLVHHEFLKRVASPRPEVSRTKTMPVLPLTLCLDVTMRTTRFNTKNAAVLHTMSSFPFESLIIVSQTAFTNDHSNRGTVLGYELKIYTRWRKKPLNAAFLLVNIE